MENKLSQEVINEIYQILKEGILTNGHDKWEKGYYKLIVDKIDTYIQENTLRLEHLKRISHLFLYISYRKSSEIGGFSTEIKSAYTREPNERLANEIVKCLIYNLLNGKHLKDSDEYLELIGMDFVDRSLEVFSENFFRYVIYGTPIRTNL